MVSFILRCDLFYFEYLVVERITAILRFKKKNLELSLYSRLHRRHRYRMQNLLLQILKGSFVDF